VANAFDSLLASFTDEGDRQALSGLAAKNPTLKEAVMLRSDYSRKQDELKHKVDLAEQWAKWREENWVDGAYGDKGGALKRELEKDKRIQELEQKLETGGDMTFDELTKHVDTLATQRGFVTQDAVAKLVNEKASGVSTLVEQSLAGYAQIAMKAPKLAVRHFRRHNEELDVEGLIDFAAKNSLTNLDDAYSKFAAEKESALAAKEAAEREAQIRAEAKAEAEKELAASRPNAMPTDDGGPVMGHFEKRIRGIKDESAPDADNLPALGRGGIAVIAAREGK